MSLWVCCAVGSSWVYVAAVCKGSLLARCQNVFGGGRLRESYDEQDMKKRVG